MREIDVLIKKVSTPFVKTYVTVNNNTWNTPNTNLQFENNNPVNLSNEEVKKKIEIEFQRRLNEHYRESKKELNEKSNFRDEFIKQSTNYNALIPDNIPVINSESFDISRFNDSDDVEKFKTYIKKLNDKELNEYLNNVINYLKYIFPISDDIFKLEEGLHRQSIKILSQKQPINEETKLIKENILLYNKIVKLIDKIRDTMAKSHILKKNARENNESNYNTKIKLGRLRSMSFDLVQQYKKKHNIK